ncbi:MAG: hypothetical protein ABSD42_12260 [Candidatus Bathyarchaeia archaeon]
MQSEHPQIYCTHVPAPQRLVLIVEQLGIGTGIPALADLGLVVAVEALFLIYVHRVVGHENNSRQLIALATGLVVPIATIGLIAELSLPLVLIVDLAFALFIWMLLRNYKPQQIVAEKGQT